MISADRDEGDSPFVDRTVPRLMIVGTGRGVGASTVVLGLLGALKKGGTSVAVGCLGPSLVQTTFYRRVLGRLVQSLDPWCLTREQFAEELVRLSSGTEFAILEGEAGIFDTWGSDFTFESPAQVAESIDIPIVLVVDARGYREGIAAVVQGFCQYKARTRIAGVICNHVESPEHNRVLKRSVESLNGPLYLGGIYRSKSLAEIEQNSKEENPSLLPRARVVASTELVESSLQLEKIREIASSSRPLKVPRELLESKPRAVRIGVADDMVFHLTVQDNLDLLRREGGELVAFSPLVDSKLPSRVAALYLPGGYPQLYARNLAANRQMAEALQDFVRRGGVIYAEGAAIAYLCRRATMNGETFEMSGVLPGNATLLETKEAPSYCEVRFIADSPIGRVDEKIRGVREYRWNIRLEAQVQYALEIEPRKTNKKSEVSAVFEGLMSTPSVIATSAQLHWASNPNIAASFIRAAIEARGRLGITDPAE